MHLSTMNAIATSYVAGILAMFVLYNVSNFLVNLGVIDDFFYTEKEDIPFVLLLSWLSFSGFIFMAILKIYSEYKNH